MTYTIRPMTQEDIAAVMYVQEDAYGPHFLEPQEIIAARYHSGLQTAWIGEIAGSAQAYLVGYCSKIGKISPLHGEFTKTEGADCFYLHDLALAQAARGTGIARALINAAVLFARDQGYSALALLSVQNSKSYWEKHGFQEYSALDSQNQSNLATYLTEGGDAHYMVRHLK